MGGAQAVAALAYGTETIARVDVIAGPGNLYVQEAKRQVSGDVGIDGFLGPSRPPRGRRRVGATPSSPRLDLLAQAEHGEGTSSPGLRARPAARRRRRAAGRRARDAAPPPRWSRSRTRPPALALAEAFAPEHLELVGAGARGAGRRACAPPAACSSAPRAPPRSATTSPGSNHSLPTGGAARFACALGAAGLPAADGRGADRRRGGGRWRGAGARDRARPRASRGTRDRCGLRENQGR